MTTLVSLILATALVDQIQAGTIQGKAVDDQGKPVPDAQVVFFTPRPWIGAGQPVELRTKTDAQGRFQLAPSRLQRAFSSQLWAYRPGWAVAASAVGSPPFDVVLHKVQPKTVKVEGPDCRPVAGARLVPLILSGAGRSSRDEIPEKLATQLGVTTGADGQASLNYLAFGDTLLTARLTAARIGTQDL